jgi:hypothetical protein
VYVCGARYGDVVLWHYAFARHWFKINLTTDLAARSWGPATMSLAAAGRARVHRLSCRGARMVSG